MRRNINVLLIATALLATAIVLVASETDKRSSPRPPAAVSAKPAIRVLFLGDKGHHKPAERAKQLLPYLASRGIEATYSENADDLNPQTLGNFDCLLIYANIEQIKPEQEKALLEYVNGGHGFVPVHCASYCFHNSPKYIELVGAEFKSHETGAFKANITAPKHPPMPGL